MNDKKNSIPFGTTDYYGREAKIRDYVLSKIEEIYKKYGFESLYTPIIENAEVFNGHHGEGEKLLFNLKDKNNNDYVLKYDSTVPLARVVSMYDIKLPYKRYQLQQSYRDDEIDKGHFREFVQCDGDVVGSDSLLTDAEFVLIAYEGLSKIGFDNFTIRLNHRKLIKAIAEKSNISSSDGILQIQRAIDMADKINKGNIEDIKKELLLCNIDEKIVDIIIDLMNICNNSDIICDNLNNVKDYFGNENKNAVEGINDLLEIVSYLPDEVLSKIKIDFTLARGADYYTGSILEAVINNLNIGAVLGGGRYDDLVSAFSNEKIGAVGLAFGMERIIVAMKDLGLDKQVVEENNSKVLMYVNKNSSQLALKLANELRKKYNVSLVSNQDISINQLKEYCENNDIKFICIPNNEDCELIELSELNIEKLSNEKVLLKTLN